jgi:hypothetical protein
MEWIKAAELDNWADRPDSISNLPELIKRLALYTSKITQRISFRAGKSVSQGGFDGFLSVEGSRYPAWIPEGDSVWEVTTDKAPRLS